MVERPSQSTPYEVHPVAALFPMLADDELADLASDIKANGLQYPIILSNGELIDGRNRLAACEIAGVEPRFEELDGQDPVAYIISANLARRHMSKGQRAMAGVMAHDLEKFKKQDVARVVGVDPGYVSQAVAVLDADPDLAAQVLTGTPPLHVAYETVQARRKETEDLQTQAQRIRDIAPDLYDQMTEEEITQVEAFEEARLRHEEEQEAAKRSAQRLEQLVNGWATLTGLADDPLREAILDSLTTHDRETVLTIEGTYQKGK